MITRTSRRVLSAASTAAVLATAVVATAVPASAVDYQDDPIAGERVPSGLSTLEILLYFVGIPALVFAVCAGLIYATASKNDPRLREGRGWWSEPEYFSADQADGAKAVPSGAAGTTELPAADDESGGSSARW